jgi:hypothetical protein
MNSTCSIWLLPFLIIAIFFSIGKIEIENQCFLMVGNDWRYEKLCIIMSITKSNVE